jgi:hypothetical protein
LLMSTNGTEPPAYCRKQRRLARARGLCGYPVRGTAKSSGRQW